MLSNVDKTGEDYSLDVYESPPVVHMLKSQYPIMAIGCGESEDYIIMIGIRICALDRKTRELP